MEYVDMKAIIHGYDPVLMESVGYMAFYNLDESARKDAKKLLKSQQVKDAKEYMNSGKRRLKEGNYDEAIRNFDSAITTLKNLKRQAENLDDDNLVTTFLIGAMKGMILALIETVIALSTIPAPVTVAIGGAIYSTGKMMREARNTAITAGMVGGLIYGIIGGTIQTGALFSQKKKVSEMNKDELKSDKAWYKIGLSRAATMSSFDNMISICEECRDQAKKLKSSSKK